jgi:Fe2+ or Zn2+ uptake regulation protein
MGEPELIFHDTVPAPIELLGKYRKKAVRQKEIVLQFFRDRYSMNFTPAEVHKFISMRGDSILLTSVRRAITDLTKEGKLTKCDYSERREGGYGHPNRTWRYTRNFVNPINPPKK